MLNDLISCVDCSLGIQCKVTQQKIACVQIKRCTKFDRCVDLVGQWTYILYIFILFTYVSK